MSALLVAALTAAAVLLARGRAAPSRAAPRPAPVRRRGGPSPRAARAETGEGLLASARTAERLAALLRAGIAPSVAWEHAADPGSSPAPAGPGGDEAPALRAVWDLVTGTGAPAAEALEACAAGLRAEADTLAAVRVAVAGPRTSARTVTFLPVVGLALGAALGAPPWVALADPVGRASAAAGLVLLVAGRWWSASLVRRAVTGGGAR